MTVEERLQKLEKELADMRLAKDVVYTESIRARVLEDAVLSGILDTTMTALNGSTTVSAFPTTINYAKQFDKRLLVYIDKIPYHIGLYS
ncbi:MAG: hypothetical protein JKY89_01370 [Immundisolibacteraceae bacterium]|nr:hypothetical protein [Immundisolibacteraceae bacterium]